MWRHNSLSAIQIANAIGAKIIAVDIGEEKLAMAKQLGAHFTVNSSVGNPREAVLEITKGGSNVSVDALGITNTCQKAILFTRRDAQNSRLSF